MTARWGSYLGVEAKKMPPTKKHRPAIWEMMLGTVNAMNDEGEVKYFDYDHDAAKEFAGVAEKKDPRVFKSKSKLVVGGDCYSTKNVRRGQMVLWVERSQ